MLNDIASVARKAAISQIFEDSTGRIREEYVDGDATAQVFHQKVDLELNDFEVVLSMLEPAAFVGEGELQFTQWELDKIAELAADILGFATDEQIARTIGLMKEALLKRHVALSTTGVIFAGFGSEELFPTLVSYEVAGTIGDRLKYAITNHVDIDREGDRARVLPFAQREMVERFLYGLDTTLQSEISTFCRNAVPKISEQIVGLLDLDDADREAIQEGAKNAENAFLQGLAKEGFEAIQASSQAEIEDMVEFMPKAEMARMAEALVNLTSIKRRVSPGFETVGGPIDVAIISKAEGFVWVTRKHYFPRELNDRYFARMGAARKGRRKDDAEDMHA